VPRPRIAQLALAVGALALLAAPTPPAAAKSRIGSQVDVADGGTRVGFWAGEAVPGTDWDIPETYWNRRDTHAYTPGLWRVLRRHQIPLYFGLRYRRDFGPVPQGMPQRNDGLRIIRRANRHGVPVWAWILVPYTDGYWAWEGAADEHFDAVRALARWARAKRIRLRGMALDPEPPLRTPFETQSAILSGGAGSALFIGQTLDPLGQCRAWHGYLRIQRWAARHDVALATAPSAIALDDAADGTLALQDAAQFIVPDAPWHGLFFQAYRSVFAYFSGRDPGPGLISSYFRSSQREFGDAGQISIGSAGRGPYRRFSNLLHDVRLAATLGVRDLPIYSLERTLRSYGGPRALVRLVHAAQRPFAGPRASKATARTPKAKRLRAAIRRSDWSTKVATPIVTAKRGAVRSANRWPGGCRD
jgi:hypothetical protein